MKNYIKYIGVGAIVLIAVVIVVGNIGKVIMSEKMKGHFLTLEEMIDSINTHLPAKGPDSLNFFVMNKVVLEGNNVVWDATIDTTLFYPARQGFLPESVNGLVLVKGDRSMPLDLDTLLSSEVMKKHLRCNLLYYYLFARSKKHNPFYDELLKRKSSQTWRYHSPFSIRQCEFTFTFQEQKDMETFCKNHEETALKEFIAEYINRQNLLLSIANNNSDIFMSMSDEGSSFVFKCAFDESYSANGNKPISYLRGNKGYIHNLLVEDTKHSLFYGIDEICEKTDKDFIIRYVDYSGTDSISFNLIHSEPISVVDKLKEEAQLFNNNNAQKLSKTNHMPCVRHVVDENSNLYVFEYLWDEEIAQVDNLNHESGMKEVLKEMASNPKSLVFMKLLIEANYGIMFRVEGSKTHKIVENKVSHKDIAALVKLAKHDLMEQQ